MYMDAMDNITITSDAIEECIRYKLGNKAPGPDKFTKSFLLQFGQPFIQFLTLLFNNLICIQVVPSLWKLAKLILLFKVKKIDPSKLKHYRPISMFDLIRKIFEYLIFEQHGHFEGLFYANQIGFHHGKQRNTGVTALDYILRSNYKISKQKRPLSSKIHSIF